MKYLLGGCNELRDITVLQKGGDATVSLTEASHVRLWSVAI